MTRLLGIAFGALAVVLCWCPTSSACGWKFCCGHGGGHSGYSGYSGYAAPGYAAPGSAPAAYSRGFTAGTGVKSCPPGYTPVICNDVWQRAELADAIGCIRSDLVGTPCVRAMGDGPDQRAMMVVGAGPGVAGPGVGTGGGCCGGNADLVPMVCRRGTWQRAGCCQRPDAYLPAYFLGKTCGVLCR
jgi:hypothetical protein